MWIEKHIIRPYLAFDSVLCEALQHNLPPMVPPPHHPSTAYPLPQVVFRMFDYTDCPEVNFILLIYYFFNFNDGFGSAVHINHGHYKGNHDSQGWQDHSEHLVLVILKLLFPLTFFTGIFFDFSFKLSHFCFFTFWYESQILWHATITWHRYSCWTTDGKDFFFGFVN